MEYVRGRYHVLESELSIACDKIRTIVSEMNTARKEWEELNEFTSKGREI